MQIPFDAVQNPQMEKFMLNNLQKMLAMGYWLDLIIFKATIHVHGYLGATTQDRDHEINNLVSSWWKGEKVESYNHWYFGTDLQTTDRCTVNLPLAGGAVKKRTLQPAFI